MSCLPEVGKVFSGCEVLACCGQGAFGIVYLAQNPLGDNIIIKVVTSSVRMERELAGLRHYMAVAGKHPSLLKILHIGEMENGFYYTMEAANNLDESGGYHPATLQNLFKRKRTFAVDEAIQITRDLLDGIKVMHEANLIHRDIKPDNIVFVKGRAKLSDPGLVVSAGEKNSLAGTVGFVPPEAINGNLPADKNFDLYAMGKVFYCMVTGLPPQQYPALPMDMDVYICRQLYPALTRMCCQNPRYRFKNVDEFLNGLPKKRLERNALSRAWENFNSWRICNRETFRNLLLAISLLLLAGLFLAFGNQLINKSIELYHQKNRNCYQQLAGQFNERADLLDLQIRCYAPQKYDDYKKMYDEFTARGRNSKLKAAIKIGRKLRAFLAATAGELATETAAEPLQNGEKDVFAKDWLKACGIYGFTVSPLADFLADKPRKKLQDTFNKIAKAGRPHNSKAFRISKSSADIQGFSHRFVCVPPGVVRMHHSRQVHKLPYCFWICDRELTHLSVYYSMKIRPQFSPYVDTPVECIAWNDVLDYCYKLTRLYKKMGVLPQGYIVRPPTEAEWEYAAVNGWLGCKDDPTLQKATFAGKAMGRTWPAGTHPANKLALFDMYGNVAEMTLAMEEKFSGNYLVVRGGSFITRPDNRFERFYLPKYDKSLKHVGARIAVAPGDMEFFEREFHLKNTIAFEHDTGVYELFCSYNARLSGAAADALCRLLGGKLAEFKDFEEYTLLRDVMPQVKKSTTVIGGMRQGDELLWKSSRLPIDKKFLFPNYKSLREDDVCSILMADKLFLARKNSGAKLFICQWSKDEYSHLPRMPQLKNGKLPLELVRFEYKNRKFVLFQSTLDFYSANRVCELIGGRLAVLDEPELLTLASEKVSAHKVHRILLGGYAKYGKNYWLNGKEIKQPLRMEIENSAPPKTVNRRFVTLKSGRLHSSQLSCMFLCEWNDSSTSSHLR